MAETTPTIHLSVQGMTCGHCAMNVSNTLTQLGANHIKVDHSKGTASFRANPTSIEPIIKQLTSLGYPSTLLQKSSQQSKLVKGLELKFVISALLTAPLMLHMISDSHIWHNPWIQLLLCLPVISIGIFHFGISALGSLKRKSLNMDVLILLGSMSAFFYSLTGTLLGLGENFLFYETAAAIVTFVLLGNLIEKTALAKTTKAVEELHSLRPQRARRLINGTTSEEVATEALNIGDMILVHAGETIPADGIIKSGQAEIDESMITGESIPVHKDIGAKVIGSTTLIKGPITVQVDSTGDSSVLYQIIKLVESAVAVKPDIHIFADKVSHVFVPIILAISILTFGLSLLAGLPLSDALLRAIAVLVIACPCAMGLATPTAVAVSVGKAAKMGILVKSGKALELLASVKTILFDKTGTLTTGYFKIKKIEPIGIDLEEARDIIVALEQHSSHPIARSLVRELNNSTRAILVDIREERGLGMSGRDSSGNNYALRGEDDLSSLVLKKNDQTVCRIFIEDEIRPHAKEAIEAIKLRGIKTLLVSGDSKEKCERLGRELGLDEIHSQMKPGDKLNLIESITKEGTTAFIGDGINDAPALAAATVGISLSSATDVAVNSAQLVLLRNDLTVLSKSLKAADSTLIAIKQNLFWALAYNLVAVPAAALGYMGPILAAFSMAFSDVIVIGNSLRLKFKNS